MQPLSSVLVYWRFVLQVLVICSAFSSNRAFPMRRHVRHVFVAHTHFFRRCHFVQYVVHKCIPHESLIVDVIKQLSDMPWGGGQKLFVMFRVKVLIAPKCDDLWFGMIYFLLQDIVNKVMITILSISVLISEAIISSVLKVLSGLSCVLTND